jgi:HlyD family secretion protein
MKGKKKRLALLIAIAVLVLAGGGYAYMLASVTPVDTALAREGAVQETLRGTGSVTAEQASVVIAKNNYEITSVLCAVGDAVEAGDRLLTTDETSGESDVLRLEAEASALRVQLTQARETARRLRTLYENGAVSESEYDAARALEQELSARLLSMQHSIQSAESGIRPNYAAAPLRGVVTELFVSAGDSAVMGQPLVEVSDLDALYIKVNLMADDAAKVRVGDRTLLTERPDDVCYVRKISPKVTESLSDLGIVQKRVEVEIALENQSGFVLGGDVDIEIVIDEADGVIVVPKKAVFSQDQKDCVYLVLDGRAVLREARVGLKGADVYEIQEGLEAGDTIIVSPGGSIVDGTRVRE